MLTKIKRMLLTYAKKHHWMLALLRKILFVLGRVKYLLFYVCNRTEDNLVIFEAYMGRQYACSPKALYLQMLQDPQYSDYRFVWAFTRPQEYSFLLNNGRTSLVKFESGTYYKAHARAKYWIANSRLNSVIIKKKEQVYIQCWHGTPLKKLGYDIMVSGGNAMNSIEDIRKKYSSDAARYTYMVSPSKYCTEKFTSCFNLPNSGIILETGYPRNDALINHKPEDAARIKSELGVPDNKKVILYAPTWRDNQHQAGVGYTYTLNIDFKSLMQKFGKNYVILFRTHYFVANQIDLTDYNGFVINVSDYDDINDLYIVSDYLITDYSSVFFDYAVLNRPILFYMYDYKEYRNYLRDFYIEFSELPGPILETQAALEDALSDLDGYNKKYAEKYKVFHDKYNYLEDGRSSERVLEKCIKKK